MSATISSKNKAPNPLPATLPAGTHGRPTGIGYDVIAATSSLQLMNDGPGCKGSWYHGRFSDQNIYALQPQSIDWSTVPAEPATPETDAEWLVRTVRELTGVEATAELPAHMCWQVYSPGKELRCAVAYASNVRERDSAMVLQNLKCASWPILSTPAPKAEPPAQPVEGVPLACGEPVTGYCAECTQPTTAFVCEGCDKRRQPTLTVRAPCGRDCSCIYCRHSTHDRQLSPAGSDALTRRAMDSSANEAGVAARARLAALDSRQAPRVNRAERKELSRAHPWECDEGDP